ncbi:MAG: hypothetical protein ABI536_02430 [Gallionella sp.]
MLQNLTYALIQVFHNFGAVTVVGTAASALWLVRGDAAVQARLALLTAIVWAVQIASGMLFGISTFYYEGHLPDIHGIAIDALFIKIGCALAGFILAIAYIKWSAGWAAPKQLLAWRALLMLGALALGCAAFLRWFS